MTPLLEVQNLSHTYSAGTPFAHKALEDVSFRVDRGEFIGVIGHTGSGKSTLMQHLNGLLKPDQGRVLLDGKDIWSDKKFTRECRFRVGLVFQYPEYQLFEETVYADIAFGPKNMGLEAAGFVGITDAQLNASPFDLSGGQKRRAAIAGIVAMEPELLILDEPTAGLDPRGREEILDNIQTYRRAKNATVMMVTHSMNDVARLADRLIVMSQSHLVLEGTPEEIFSDPQSLVDMGLDVPEVTRVFLALEKRGLRLPRVYTLDQAVAALAALKGGARHA